MKSQLLTFALLAASVSARWAMGGCPTLPTSISYTNAMSGSRNH